MNFLGIDVSTTATKAILVDACGEVLCTASSTYDYETPQPLWCEQDPQLWWQAAQEAIRSVLNQSGIEPAQIQGIGLTGQMHGLVLLDEHGGVLRKAILWNDQRTHAQCDGIHRLLGLERFIQISGNQSLPGFTAPKILWVREHEPEVYGKIAHVLLPKDYVRYQLTGKYATDKSDGAGTVLTDLQARDWSNEILAALDVNPAWMPQLFEGPQITGSITAQAATATGLIAGTPVVAGGGDQAAQAIGVGAVREGIVALTLGTSGVIFATADQPIVEKEGRLHAFCHAVPKKWHLMGVMLSAGGSLRWYRDCFSRGTSYDALLAPAECIPAGSEGLIFLPYLTGERTPHADPLARSAFIGLSVRHGMPHCTRAILEGVAFGLRDSFELMKSVGLGPIQQMRVSGGGALSRLWVQILASVFECELVTVNTIEGAAYGAALLSGVGTGHWMSVAEACEVGTRVSKKILPDFHQAERYRQIYPIYRELYPTLQPCFAQLSDVAQAGSI